MSSMLSSVEAQTNLAGQNRFQMLLFTIGHQPYGINVFKVREVVRDVTSISSLPASHPYVLGVVTMRGESMPLIDLGAIVKGQPTTDLRHGTILVTEFNRTQQAFLVDQVEAIETVNWSQISPTPKSSHSAFITGVCHLEERLVLIPDVEEILENIAPKDDVTLDIDDGTMSMVSAGGTILIADDSSVARKQVERAFANMPYDLVTVTNGAEALEKAKELAASGSLRLILSDIEMPEMDGYTLTAECRNDASLKKIPVILHSSLSGAFNTALVERVGADEFVAKFSGDELLKAVSHFL